MKVEKQLRIFYEFRQEVKDLKQKSKNNFLPGGVFLISKKDIRKWKNYYSYSEDIFSDTSSLNQWKLQNEGKHAIGSEPKLKLLSKLNEIKNNLKEGITIVNRSFVDEVKIKNIPKEIKCYIGNNRILLDIDDKVYLHCFICKIGKKENTRYITFEKIRNASKI